MQAIKPLPVDKLHEQFRLEYVHEDDGYLNCHVISKMSGKRLGFLNAQGRRAICIKDGARWVWAKEHRVIYAMFHNKSEFALLDHIDQNPLHNHPDNLRESTKSKNGLNSLKRKGYTKHPLVGFNAYIGSGDKIERKWFKTEEEAIEWRAMKKAEWLKELQML